MKRFVLCVLAIALGCVFAVQCMARTHVKIGIFGTHVRTTDCNANIQASRCGVQFNGGYGGGCGEQVGNHGCGGGGCGTGQAHPRCATCPQNGCVPCGQQSNHCPPYGTRTRTCIDSNVPYVDPLQFGAQMRYRGY